MGKLVDIRKADRDQNSLRSPVATHIVMPKIEHRSGSVKATAGGDRGKTRGVGRHLTRDQNSSPGSAKVRTPTLRELNGKFAGQGYGVKHYTPSGRKKGSVHSSGAFHTVKKNDDRKGLLGEYDLANMQHHAGNRVGRRIAAS